MENLLAATVENISKKTQKRLNLDKKLWEAEMRKDILRKLIKDRDYEEKIDELA
jgi:hypothetical protein